MSADFQVRLPPNIPFLLHDTSNYYTIFTTTWLDNSISVMKLVSTSLYSYPNKKPNQSGHHQLKHCSDWIIL
jgi:hypothetical protein